MRVSGDGVGLSRRLFSILPSLISLLTTLTFMPVLRVSQTMVKPFTSSGISDKAFSTCNRVREEGIEGVREGGREEKWCLWVKQEQLEEEKQGRKEGEKE